jgi:hypothetical protein
MSIAKSFFHVNHILLGVARFTMKRNKKIASIVFAVVVIGAATAAVRFQGQNQKSGQGQDREQATVIQEGQMTEKQRQHSKLFGKYGDVTHGKKLTELSLSGDVDVLREKGDEILTQSSYLSITDYLSLLACHADAIVVGVVENKSSQLIDDGTFLFTDYSFRPQEVLKDNGYDPLQVDFEITVTRIGGLATLNGHTVRAVDETQKSLRAGSRYLLFLRYIPATRAYRSMGTTSGDDSFELVDANIAQVSERHAPLGSSSKKTDQPSFFSKVHDAVKRSCP